jgi:hypothetical protein
MTCRGDTDGVDHPADLFDADQPLAECPGIERGRVDVSQPIHRRHRATDRVSDAIRW